MLKLIPALFSLDYSSNSPEYKGYYPADQATAAFKTPFFEKEVVESIIKEWNDGATNDPEAGYDTFKWDGDALIWTQFEIDEPVTITPEYATVNGKEIKVYPIGHGSWNWEMGE